MVRTPSLHQLKTRSPEARDFLYEARMEAHRHHPKTLADRAGISVQTVYAFRSGRTIWPRYTTLFPLLEALGYELRLVRTGQNDWSEQ